MKHFTLLLTVLFSLGFGRQTEIPYVLLISFDGFRADYLDWYKPQHFRALAAEGVSAEHMQPVFVTKTFPNHYTLATGMYIENHGLIDNYFYDEKFDETYRLSDRGKVEDARFYGGEPIWVTAEKQGVRAASMFWVGSEAAVGGVHPSIWKRYDHHMPFYDRVDSVATWFSLPENRRPHLVTLYFHEPDETSHRFGVRSPETESKIAALDSLLGYILSTMKALEIYPQLNIIVVSDHGMTDLTPVQTINLTDYVDLTGITQERAGPFSFLYPVKGRAARRLVRRLDRIPHLTAYRKEDIPERYHYRNHYRIKDVLLVADEGWSILDKTKGDDPEYAAGLTRGATHGYDNQLRSMQAIFLADGPAFRDGYRRDEIQNIMIYPIIARILGLRPNPEADGKVGAVSDLFR